MNDIQYINILKIVFDKCILKLTYKLYLELFEF